MTTTTDQRLYILSFDHRGSFKKGLMSIAGEPTGQQRAQISELKTVIYAGFERAIADGAPRDACGVLVDEEFGAEIARSARAAGFTLAMPVERSGQDEFDFEFGEDFAEHIEAFDPDFAKVLVRYNPDGDQELNRRQAERLARLSERLHAQQDDSRAAQSGEAGRRAGGRRERKFLFELLVPATAAQLEQVAGDQDAYDRDLRPALVVGTLEGLEARVDCERVVAQAQAGGREDVRCVLLGRGANLARVARWLKIAAPVEGYVGLAIGRTIWLEALTEHLAGRLERDAAVAQIAVNYRQMIDTYAAAGTALEPATRAADDIT